MASMFVYANEPVTSLNGKEVIVKAVAPDHGDT